MGINLPNGANVEEIVLPNGSNAERVIGPDGSTLWERNTIPDSDAYRYLVDEGSGPVFNDTSTGDKVDATHNGGWENRADAIGGEAATYNGSDEYAQTDDTVPVNGNEFTVVGVVQPNTVHRGGIFTTTDDPSSLVPDGFIVQLTEDGDVFTLFADDGDREPTATVEGYNADEWLFITLTGNGNDANLRVWTVDGQLGTASGSQNRSQTDERLTFGVYFDNYFDGSVSYTQAWTSEKSEAELSDIWDIIKGEHQ